MTTTRADARAGSSPETTEREQTALHEAAHAVADVRFEFGTLGITIQSRDGLLGGARALDSWADEASARNQLISLYAGYAVEIRVGVNPEKARLHADDDFMQAALILEALGPDDTELAWTARAEQFVADPRNWRSVVAIASEVLEWGSLNEDEVELIVAREDGDPDAEIALARCRRHSGRM